MLDLRVQPPADLGLILSYQCQSACRHCLYNCGPSWQEWMSIETVQAALEVASHWKGSIQVHFTGGEPFLNFELLERAVRLAARLDLPRYVETNAAWCVCQEQVADRFRRLHEAGLQAILISCSPFHAENIPLTRTLLAIDQAITHFGYDRVIVYLLEWIDQIRRFGLQNPVAISCYTTAYGPGAGLMLWEGYDLRSGGRAGYRLGYLIERLPPEAFRGMICAGEILRPDHAHFDLYGNYIPGFCGGLSLGGWRDLPGLLANLAAGRIPPLAAILVSSGPYGLYEMAVQRYSYNDIKGGYAGKCHLCTDVRRHLAGCASFAELQPLAFYQSF